MNKIKQLKDFNINKLDTKLMLVAGFATTTVILGAILFTQWKYINLGKKTERAVTAFLVHTGSKQSHGVIEGGHLKSKLPLHTAVILTVIAALEQVDKHNIQHINNSSDGDTPVYNTLASDVYKNESIQPDRNTIEQVNETIKRSNAEDTVQSIENYLPKNMNNPPKNIPDEVLHSSTIIDDGGYGVSDKRSKSCMDFKYNPDEVLNEKIKTIKPDESIIKTIDSSAKYDLI